MSLRHKIMIVAVIVLGILLFLKYGSPTASIAALPLPGNIAGQEKELLKRHRQLVNLKNQKALRSEALDLLRVQAEPFWHVGGKNSREAVAAELSRLARNAQVKPARTGTPSKNQIFDLDHIHEVEISVRLIGSMREVTRWLAELERADHTLFWSRCTIRPDNRNSPKQVSLTGKIRALVLSEEAGDFVAAGEEELP